MKIERVNRNDFNKIISMLQDISAFVPEQHLENEIWNNFINQDNVEGFSFFKDNVLVGYGSIVFEIKIRGGKMGHIEDIVVNEDFRGLGIGYKIIKHLVNQAKKNGCYKVSLSCKENNIKFYEKCGFVNDGITMQKQL